MSLGYFHKHTRIVDQLHTIPQFQPWEVTGWIPRMGFYASQELGIPTFDVQSDNVFVGPYSATPSFALNAAICSFSVAAASYVYSLPGTAANFDGKAPTTVIV